MRRRKGTRRLIRPLESARVRRPAVFSEKWLTSKLSSSVVMSEADDLSTSVQWENIQDKLTPQLDDREHEPGLHSAVARQCDMFRVLWSQAVKGFVDTRRARGTRVGAAKSMTIVTKLCDTADSLRAKIKSKDSVAVTAMQEELAAAMADMATVQKKRLKSSCAKSRAWGPNEA
ncbi:Aste57867_19138 [Aphanomyces stellatus]|uniref:Aste57867_19138 protein n=1 Tax=Aphanomyces stellatus TaxID=120398 RepID=A0A485LCH6_9STRA|nr:hypothetical protein As57867_019074 [Aphanomyces stellatus]VFT95861.1 Aste57867_19138 [Aphanomyces stellatus]